MSEAKNEWTEKMSVLCLLNETVLRDWLIVYLFEYHSNGL